MNENQRIKGPAKPLEELDIQRENNLSYLTFSTKILFRIIVTLVFLLVLSSIANFYFFFSYKDVKFIALTPDMRVVEVSPLDEPLISDAGLLSWYMQTMSDSFSFTYNDWKDRISALQNRFTPEAFQAIVTGLYPFFERIAEKRQIMNMLFLRIPRIIQKGVLRKNGPYTWIVEGYAQITIEGGQSQAGQNILIKVIIERVNPAIVPNGVIIKSVVFKPT